MEFGERKRSRKSQSFKLLSAGVAAEAPISEPKDATAKPREDWVGEEGMEIKRQITGMMKILSDRSVRGYQRVGLVLSQDSGEDGGQSAPLQLPDHAWASVEGIAPSTLSSTHTNGPGTRSRAQRAVHSTKDLTKTLQVNDSRPPSAEPPCCMCNCKDTLQAILQELQAMRKMMQSEKEKQEPNAILPSQPVVLGPTPPHRPLKRRPIYKVPPLTVCAARHAPVSPVPACAPVFAPASAPASAPAHSGGTSDAVRPVDTFRALGQSVDAQPDNSDPTSLLHPPSKHLESEPEVRLVEDFDVFISKAQLDSILINYTRSGSLLFRKLVCAFFNDATLASSLPNGKRKRGLNDNRKGLDQNIVGAVKAFTEKYCIEHNIEKLPGPRDWVQILQDQIKLARRRLRRDAAEDKI